MKPVQTQDVQELLYTLAMQTDSQTLRYAAADMIDRLEVEKEQKAQASYYVVLDQMAQSNVNVSDYEKECLEEKLDTAKHLLKGMAELL